MVCDYCHTVLDPKTAKFHNRLVFHPECREAYREDLRIIRERCEAELAATPNQGVST